MRSIMIAIKPKWCKLIFAGEKTREIRKTLPDTGEPFKAYIYATRAENWKRPGLDFDIQLSGHVVGEFVCYMYDRFYWRDMSDTTAKLAMLTVDDLKKYVGVNDMLYSWRISDLKEYDEPLDVADFLDNKGNIMKRPPQSWQYVTPRYFLDAKAGWKT